MKTHFSRRELYALGEPLGECATYELAGRRVYGGGGGFIGDVLGGVGDIVGGIGNLGQGVIDTVSSVGSSLDDAIRENIPGGWALPVIAATSGALGGESLLGGAASAGAGEAGLGSLLTDMGAAGAYDAGLAGVGSNVGAGVGSLLTDAGLAGAYDAGLSGVGANVAPDYMSALGYDEGLTGAGSNVGADFASAANYDAGLSGVGSNAGAGLGLGSGLASVANSLFGSNLTGAGALTALLGGGLGLAGIKSLLDSDAKKYGVPGVQQYAGPMNRFSYNPSVYQPTRVDPNMFKPRTMAAGGSAIVPDPDAVPPGIGDSVIRMAEGGQSKPKYTGKAALALMQPWQRAQAELNNAAAMGRMPVGAQMPQGRVGQLGQYAGGGIASLGGYSDGGRMLKGPGDGMSDSIPATIANRQPARLANEEFVIPADVVSHLGNGSSEAGAKQLYKMMDRVRHARTGTKKQGKEIKPEKYMPA